MHNGIVYVLDREQTWKVSVGTFDSWKPLRSLPQNVAKPSLLRLECGVVCTTLKQFFSCWRKLSSKSNILTYICEGTLDVLILTWQRYIIFTWAYLWPWPGGPDWWTAVCVAGLPPCRGGLGAARVSQVVHVGLAGPLDTLDMPHLLPSSTALATNPPLSYRPAGTTQHKPAESTGSF